MGTKARFSRAVRLLIAVGVSSGCGAMKHQGSAAVLDRYRTYLVVGNGARERLLLMYVDEFWASLSAPRDAGKGASDGESVRYAVFPTGKGNFVQQVDFNDDGRVDLLLGTSAKFSGFWLTMNEMGRGVYQCLRLAREPEQMSQCAEYLRPPVRGLLPRDGGQGGPFAPDDYAFTDLLRPHCTGTPGSGLREQLMSPDAKERATRKKYAERGLHDYVPKAVTDYSDNEVVVALAQEAAVALSEVVNLADDPNVSDDAWTDAVDAAGLAMERLDTAVRAAHGERRAYENRGPTNARRNAPNPKGGKPAFGEGGTVRGEDRRCSSTRSLIPLWTSHEFCDGRDLDACRRRVEDVFYNVTDGACGLVTGSDGGDHLRCTGDEESSTFLGRLLGTGAGGARCQDVPGPTDGHWRRRCGSQDFGNQALLDQTPAAAVLVKGCVLDNCPHIDGP